MHDSKIRIVLLFIFFLFKSVLVYLRFEMYVFIGITRLRDSHCNAMELHFDCVLWLEFIVHTHKHTFTVPLNQRLKAYETVTLCNYETKVIINRRINNRSNNNSKKKIGSVCTCRFLGFCFVALAETFFQIQVSMGSKLLCRGQMLLFYAIEINACMSNICPLAVTLNWFHTPSILFFFHLYSDKCV